MSLGIDGPGRLACAWADLRVWRLAAAAAVLIATGCGDGRPRIVPTSGVVLMNGKPLTGHAGFVRVVPAGTRSATGRIDPADGRFSLTTYEAGDGCVEGTHPVAVIVNTTIGGTRLVWITPERYGDDKTSGLTVDITGDKAEVELRLEGRLTPVPAASEADRRQEERG
jgi:hypothetical protein